MSNPELEAQLAAALAELAALKARSTKAGTLPMVSVVRYTNKNEQTKVFLRVSMNGQEWGSSLIRLNEGEALTTEGRNQIIALANALGDLVDAKEIPVTKHGKK